MSQSAAQPALAPSSASATHVYGYLTGHLQPDSVGVITGDVATTYGEVMTETDKLASTLAHLQIGKGDAVCLIAENSVFWIACYLAILKLGAVVVPLPLRLTVEQVRAAQAMVDCKAACIDAAHVGVFAPAFDAGACLISDRAVMVPDRAVHVPVIYGPTSACAVNDREDLAALMFTSGSTGQPNAVKITHRNIIANTDSILEYLELTPNDRIMVVLPFEYCFGTSLLHTHLRIGGSMVLFNHFMFLEDLLNEMARHACSGLAGVPSTFQYLLRRSSLPRRQFPHLRYVQQAGGRLPEAFIKEFLQAQPNVRFFVMYGQTEATARLSYLPPERLVDKLGSIGRGIPGVQLAVLRADGKPVVSGEVGEIVAEGDNVSPGYWASEPSRQPFRNGKLYTGDMARVDDEGFIYVVDRVSDFIKAGGHRVSSREIEEVLAQIPDLVEVAVVGIPHDELGEAVRAFVVPRRCSALTERDILDYCKTRLASYMVPREITFMNALPKNGAQKVLKNALKGMPSGAANTH